MYGTLNSLGDAYGGTGWPREALPWREKLLAVLEHILTLHPNPETHYYSLESWRDAALPALGRALAEVGRADEGRPKLEAAVRGLESLFADRTGDPDVRRKLTAAHANLARLLAREGDAAGVARHADRAREVLGGIDPPISDDHYQRAALAALRASAADPAERDRLGAEAVAAPEAAFTAGFRCAPLLKHDPAFDAIRGLPAFQGFARRIEAAAESVGR